MELKTIISRKIMFLLVLLPKFYAQFRHHASWNLSEYSGLISERSYPQTEPQASAHRLRHTSIAFDELNSHCRIGTEEVSCSPPFQNIAQNVRVHVTSNCGYPKVQRLCHSDGTCQICDSKSTNQHFSPSQLTDIHKPHNQTCWSSGAAQPGGLDKAVNLTLSLGKRFEVFHISLLPCLIGRIPDSIAIFKSSDFGQTWKPWHYFSTDCYRAFGLPTTDDFNTHITNANLQEVLCVALQPHEIYLTKQFRRRRSMHLMRAARWNHSTFSKNAGPASDVAITFSTTLGRPSSRPWSPALVDWMTMTDVRISLMRFASAPTSDYRTKRTSGLFDHAQLERAPRKRFSWSKDKERNYRSQYNQSVGSSWWKGSPWYLSRLPRSSDFNDLRISSLEDSGHGSESSPSENAHVTQISLTEEPDVLAGNEFYAFADLVVGGWCKCNGHARDCVQGVDGHVTCACEHNTEGPDCERCKQGYMDRPWDRATPNKANACTQCDCNLHSNECRFSNALYLMSNRISGGVCENCQHNTAGRHCQHCAEGFYRDWTKPPSHEQVCLPCRCHPIGSVIRHDCDRRSGQCRCKQGVTGLTCDRCQDGYHQTRSPTNPCTKDYFGHAVALAHTPVDLRCQTCESNKERIRLKKFCRKDAVFQAIFRSRELHRTMARFEMHVLQIWRLNRKPNEAYRTLYLPATTKTQADDLSENNRSDMLKLMSENVVPIWARLNELRCKCPEIELGISYLIVTDFEIYSHRGRDELLFTPKTALLPWRPSWKRRLMRFQRRQNRGACERFQETSKLNTESEEDFERTSSLHSQNPNNPTPHSNTQTRAAYRTGHSNIKRYNPYSS